VLTLPRAVVPAALAGWIVIGAAAGQSQQAPPRQNPPVPAGIPDAPPDAAGPEKFNGTWDYNAQLSVNAATGRPEQAPRSATQRTQPPPQQPRSGDPNGGSGGRGGSPMPPGYGPTGSGSSGSGMGGGMGGTGGGMGGMGGGMPRGLGMSPMGLAEMRTLTRDLMEVPEKLTLKVSPESISVTDDLERERIYPTDGKERKYQLSGAQYEARVFWNGPQLKREIKGGYNFKLTEVAFLSADGNRMYVIIRLGDQTKKPPPPVVGVNRVYDRVVELPAERAGRAR
jgi:hypothetical protein